MSEQSVFKDLPNSLFCLCCDKVLDWLEQQTTDASIDFEAFFVLSATGLLE